jgi:hypothetical protein
MPVYSFCTVEDVKAFGSMASSFTEYDSLLAEQLIPAATELVRTFCRRSFVDEGLALVEFFPTAFCLEPAIFRLRQAPVLSSPAPIVKVSYAFVPVWSAVTALAPEFYETDLVQGKLTLLGGTYHSRAGVRIEYCAGYTANNVGLVAVPQAIKTATALQANYMLESALNKDTGRTATLTGKGGTGIARHPSVFVGPVPEAALLLVPYRRTLTGKLYG